METREYQGTIYQRSGPGADWVAVGSASGAQGGAGGRIIPKAVNPADAYEVPKAQANIDQSRQGTERSAALLPTDLEKNQNDAARSAYERDKARFDVTGQQQGRNFERADKLRADYEALPSVKSYTQALPVFGAGLQSKADAAGDLNLIYAYAKVMDPNSVVREGEQASVAGGDTWINAKTAALQKQLGQGGTFKPEYRKRLREEMAGRMGELNQSFIADRVRYKGISDRYGVNPQDVVGEHPGARFQDVSERVLGRKQQELDYNGMPIATGASRTEKDPKTSKLLDTLVRGGATVDEINATLQPLGMRPIEQAQYDTVKKFLAANPNYQGVLGDATKEVNNSLATRFAGSPTGTFIGAAADAGIGGLSDEIAGTVQSAFNGQPISANIDRLNKAKQAAFGQNPKAAIGGQITGQIGQLFGAGALARGAGMGAGLLPQLGLDAGLSAVSGAGQNNDSRLMGSAVGGLTGAAGNLAGRGLASGVGALARTQPGLAALNRTRSLFGSRLSPIQPAQALSPAEGSLAAPLAGSADDVTGALENARNLNTPFTLADTTPALGELAGASARRSPQALNLAEDVLGRRSRGQIDRLEQAVTRDLGPVENIPQLSADLSRQAKTDADPLYAAFRQNQPATSPEIDSLLQTPFGKSSLSRAETIAANERLDPNLLLPNRAGDAPGYAPESLDLIKRGMDTVLERHRNPMTGRLDLTGNPGAQAQDGVRKQFISAVDEVNPDYAAARAAYGGPMQSRDHLDAGMSAYSANPNQLGVDLSGASAEKIGQMQLGHRGALMDHANSVRYNSNPWNATLGTPAAEQRIGTLYPDNPGVQNLFAQRDLENQMARTATRVVGGSQTAGRQVADQSFLPGAAASGAIDLATAASGGVPVASLARMAMSSKLGDALRLGLGKKAEAKATELAPMLLNDSPDANLALVRQLLDKNQAYQQFVTKTTPKRAGGIFGAAMLSGGADRYVN